MLEIPSATVHKIETTSDHGLKIILHTREVSPDIMAALFLAKQSGTEGVKIEEPETDDLKSPSQRLRSVLYVVWSNTDMKEDFDTYYRINMQKIIDHYKDKLP